MPGGGKPRHVDADLGDDGGRGDRADTGDLIEMGRRVGERGQLRLDLGVDGGDVGLFRVSRGGAVWSWVAAAVIGGCRPTVPGGVDCLVF